MTVLTRWDHILQHDGDKISFCEFRRFGYPVVTYRIKYKYINDRMQGGLLSRDFSHWLRE